MSGSGTDVAHETQDMDISGEISHINTTFDFLVVAWVLDDG